ncbi:MAG: hypothetical protein WBP45_10800 [Daejeonella sp.]
MKTHIQDSYMDLLSINIGLLMPDLLIKSGNLAKWNRFFKDGVINSTGNSLKVGDNIAGKIVQQVKNGTNGKVAVIGRKMNGYVKTVAEKLKLQGKNVEIFDKGYFPDGYEFNIDGQMKSWVDIENDFTALKQQYVTIPDDALKNTLMYKANQAWAQKLKTQGYTVIDIGYPTGETSISVFYNMELNIIFK